MAVNLRSACMRQDIIYFIVVQSKIELCFGYLSR
jgi:hypothetical protein